MSRKWTTMKSIIEAYEQREDLFLSLIDEEGTIVCANANMVKTLHLKNLKSNKVNFFDLMHPVNIEEFKKVVHNSRESNNPHATELYLKNGCYHPMKWQVNYLKDAGQDKTYLCVGHKLLDDKRLLEFNRLGAKNYQLIVEGLNAGVLFQDASGELIAANQKTAEIFDTTLERLYQLTNIKNLWDNQWIITTEQGEKVCFENTPFIKALHSGRPEGQVLVIQMRSGEPRRLCFSSQPLFEEGSQQPYSVVSNIVDVTQERKLSEELSRKNAVFNAFMDKTPNLAWVLDEEGKLIFGSKAFYEYFCLEEKESLHKTLVDLIPKVVANALFDKHLKVMRSGLPLQTVEKVKWADGTSCMFHINLFPIEGASGKKLLGGHAVNLADKYKVEKQLQEANDRLMQLTRATSDSIWEWDMQTGRIFRNDALMEMIGYQLDDPKGLSWWLRRIHPEDRNRVSDKVKEVTEKNLQSWEDKYRFKCADGQYKHMQDKGFIVYENGLPVKMIGSLQDVSTLRELEDQLTQEKFRSQKEISETVIRVQEKERTRIGHELHDNINQILSTTKLFVDMLTPSSKEEKHIKSKSIEYIMMAIEEIRILSKDLVVPQLQGKGLVDSIRTMIDDIHISDVIKIKFTHDNETDLLSPGKKVTLFRIVQEQLKNILKYSKAKQVEILLQCRDNAAELIIKDNGIGFDPKQTPRGIGLSNIYERTRFYNGEVDIKTASGQGCILRISIPVLD